MLNSTIDYAMIGKRIKNKRTESKITQEKMANDLNLSTFYISKIENGKSCPTLDTLSIIANYLELDLAFLITGTSTLEKTIISSNLMKYVQRLQTNSLISL